MKTINSIREIKVGDRVTNIRGGRNRVWIVAELNHCNQKKVLLVKPDSNIEHISNRRTVAYEGLIKNFSKLEK